MRMPQTLWNRRIFYLAVSFLVFIVFSNIWSEYSRRRDLPDIPLAEKHIHLLLTAPSSSIHLCKFLLTAAVLGYPTPTIINWNKDYAKEQGHHIEKLRGVITYLDSLKYENRRDLIVVVDAHDVWFQLRPSVLIERYHAINRASLARMSRRPGMARAMREKGIKQTVIFGADKRCAATASDPQGHPYCYLQPEPDTPEDMYGAITDQLDSQGSLSRFRPRYLNEGFIVGEAADLRAILARAFERVDQSKPPLEQSPLSIVFAEQELIREIWRQERHQEVGGSQAAAAASWAIAGAASPSEYDQKLASMAKSPEHKYFHMHDAHANAEVHLGVDYGSLLSHSTALSDRDWRHLAFNTTPPHRLWDDDVGDIPADCKGRVPARLPQDILSSRAPISEAISVPSLPYPLPSWEQLPLYTDVCTGNIPVTIHHNGDKSQIERQWPHLWLQPWAQQLRIGQAQLAIMSLKAAGPSINDGGANTDAGQKLEWADMCENQLWGNELYDGKPFGASAEAAR